MPPFISVVVCTYNRAPLLANVMQSLGEQTFPPSEYEVIIVDNNSTDETRDVAERFRIEYDNIRYFFEPRQGLSHARNRGWQEACGEYVGYIDDDAKAPEQWLEVAKDVIKQKEPDVFGGPFYAFYRTPKPRWFKDTYGSRDRGNEARALSEDEHLYGGNIFFRRTLFERHGGFNTSLGMTGYAIAYGEETALVRRIRRSEDSAVICYEPALYVYHLVRAQKMTLCWNLRQRFASGRYAYQVLRANSPPKGMLRLTGWMVLTALRFATDLAQGAIARDREQYPYVQNFWYERAFEHVQKLGAIYERYLEEFRLQE